MAEANANTNTQQNQAEPNSTHTEPNGGKQPSIEELMAELAAAKADRDKFKNASDKATSEAAKFKRELRSRQTAEEQAAEEKAEADRLAAEETENLKKELNHIKAIAAYKSISEGKTVETLVEAIAEADHNAIAAIIENEKARAVKEAKAEWQKSRPYANTGNGEGAALTKEQFEKMSIADKSKLYRENQAEYERLKAL